MTAGFDPQMLAPDAPAQILLLLAIVSARALGFVLLQPIFGRFKLNAGYLRGAVMVALVLPVMPGAMAAVAGNPDLIAPAAVPGLMARELAVGMVLGLLVGLPFWAMAAAGDFMDQQRGAMMANLFDPGAGGESSVSGTFLMLVCVLVLVAGGALTQALFAPLLNSYQVVPLFAPLPPLDPRLGALALGLLDQCLRSGLLLALPVVVPLLLTEISVAVAVKYMPQVNAMFLSMSVKQVVHMLILLLGAAMLAGYAAGVLGDPTLQPGALRLFFPDPATPATPP